MHLFRVWAPLAREVAVEVNGARHAMAEESGGWRRAEVASAKAGDDYGFLIDGEGPFPDPRSPWQPQGVHELSRLPDPASFPWTDQRWEAPPLSSAVFYELHVGTFAPEGTFAAVAGRLDHLASLGVTHVELMPVNEFSGNHGWGYDGVDLFAPHHAYGAPDELKKLVDACHARGLAVYLDVVYNHLGPSGNYLGKFGPYFNPHYSTPWGAALNFEGPDNGEVRRFFCDNALMWLRDYHFDGLRLDAVHAIIDTSAEPFLEQLEREVKALAAATGRHLALIPESDLNDPRLLASREAGGFALDAQWSDDFHHALHAVLTGEKEGYYGDFGTLADLTKALKDAWVYDGRYSSFRRRKHGRPHNRLGGERFLGYWQNHDQVGNRAKGERSSQLVSEGQLKIGAALVLTAPFLPMLFMGEEWGAATPFLYFTDHPDPELARAVREGRRKEFVAFGWKPDEIPDPQAPESFAASKLNWAELQAEPHRGLLDWHKKLIHLRRSEPDLSDGRLDKVEIHFDESARWLVMERGAIIVACNLQNAPQTIPLRAARRELLLASGAANVHETSLELPPESVAILRAQPNA
jgi:maltooligosyltrehalose trehalohydrolase